jgi:hypothetical protein
LDKQELREVTLAGELYLKIRISAVKVESSGKKQKMKARHDKTTAKIVSFG